MWNKFRRSCNLTWQFLFGFVKLRDDQILLSGIIYYLGVNTLPGASHLPIWRTDGVIITILLHVGPVEFLYYWFHRALHHHYLYSYYHSHHHSSIVTEPITCKTYYIFFFHHKIHLWFLNFKYLLMILISKI